MLPLGFLINKTGTAADNLLTLTYSFNIYSVKYF